MDHDALAEALAVLRAADELRRALPLGSRDRAMIEAQIGVLNREIRSLLAIPDEGAPPDVSSLRAASRATQIRIGELQEHLRG